MVANLNNLLGTLINATFKAIVYSFFAAILLQFVLRTVLKIHINYRQAYKLSLFTSFLSFTLESWALYTIINNLNPDLMLQLSAPVTLALGFVTFAISAIIYGIKVVGEKGNEIGYLNGLKILLVQYSFVLAFITLLAIAYFVLNIVLHNYFLSLAIGLLLLGVLLYLLIKFTATLEAISIWIANNITVVITLLITIMTLMVVGDAYLRCPGLFWQGR